MGRLTFGVEIEFVLARKKAKFLNLDGADAWLKSPEFLEKTASSRNWEENREGNGAGGSGLDLPTEYSRLVAQRIIERAGLDVQWQVAKEHGYEAWSLVGDESILRPYYNDDKENKEMILKRWPDRVSESELDNHRWRRDGMELVSPILQAPEPVRDMLTNDGITEVKKYISALLGRAGDPFAAYVNNGCGLHVHVGVDPHTSQKLPVDILKFVAYFCVQFEGLISKLHPPRRRGLRLPNGDSNHYVGPSLPSIKDLQEYHVCDRHPIPPIEALKQRIFTPTLDALESPIEHLAIYMSTDPGQNRPVRSRFVNWGNFANFTDFPEQQKGTLEFRQHAGTLDQDEIAHWVCFVIAIVRAAERRALRAKQLEQLIPPPDSPTRGIMKANEERPAPFSNPTKHVVERHGRIEQFKVMCDYLDLPDAHRKYWRKRFDQYDLIEYDPLVVCEYCESEFLVLVEVKRTHAHFRQLEFIYDTRSKSTGKNPMDTAAKEEVWRWIQHIQQEVQRIHSVQGKSAVRDFFANPSNYHNCVPIELRIGHSHDYLLQECKEDQGPENETFCVKDAEPDYRTAENRNEEFFLGTAKGDRKRGVYNISPGSSTVFPYW